MSILYEQTAELKKCRKLSGETVFSFAKYNHTLPQSHEETLASITDKWKIIYICRVSKNYSNYLNYIKISAWVLLNQRIAFQKKKGMHTNR